MSSTQETLQVGGIKFEDVLDSGWRFLPDEDMLEYLPPIQVSGDHPSGQATSTSPADLGRGWSLNATWRYVGALPSPSLPATSSSTGV